jgi:hypothetical protein
MLAGKGLKVVGVLTLFFFMFFVLSADLISAQQEDDALLKARRLYQSGDYEGSIKLLGDFITKLRAMVEQKKNVAEAFYLLAKIYYEVGDDTKVDENLRKCFETFPSFTMEESNLGLKSRMDKVRKEVLEKKTQAVTEEEETTVEPEEYPAEQQEKVVPQYRPEKKKKKFPVLLVVGGIVVVGAVIALAAGKKSKNDEIVYDIRGDWTVTLNYLGSEIPFYITYNGSLNSGTFVDQDGDTGTYTVNGRSVSFQYSFYNISFTGNFSDRDNMNGNYQADDVTGSWHGNRGFTMPITYKAASIKTETHKK